MLLIELKCRATSLMSCFENKYCTDSEQNPEFQNYVQGIFRRIIRRDKKYVKHQYTIFVTLCEIFPCLLRPLEKVMFLAHFEYS